MMSLCGNWIALFLCASPVLHFHRLTHAATTSPPVTRTGIKYTAFDFAYDGDDDDDDDSSDVVSQKRTTVLQHRPPRPCNYDSCLENQEPCESLAKQHGCLCPGVSRADEPPHPPRIQSLKPISAGADRGKIEVQWCAPSSVVQKYRVVVQGEGDSLEFKDVSRRGVIGSVEVGTKVCVEAVNNAGSSSPSDFACMRFDHSESPDHTKLFLGGIAGGVILLILIITAVIFWKCCMLKKAKTDSTDGLGNPSYSTEGTL
ncbi:LRRN4 C-terminal-like protein [Halichoeres trimaculatus]|uniref:LRRN4 C-terminal-like protein n=1 Tax=Halichoeres trimaculatus TaxID=147232 RepID=UPI003D9DC7F6